MSGAHPGIWVVIPAYNETASIRNIVERTLAILPRVVVVDDGSDEPLEKALRGLPATVLRNKTNGGKAAALVRGFSHALEHGAVAVVALDGDGQHRPEDIPRLIEAARHHPRHIVIGARLIGFENAPRSRRRANRIANFWIGWAAGHRIVDSQSGFRLYPAELLLSVRPAHDCAHGFVFESEILIAAARKGFRTTPVTIEALYPLAARSSHFAPVRDIMRITRMVAWRLLCAGLHPVGLWRSLSDNPPSRVATYASHLGR
ncbi:MAG: glycosyltransferase family 2 protein [Casimicrobiaceae bacterium]